MSTAAKLKAEGEAAGIWIGKIQLLEQLMGGAITPEAELSTMETSVLEKRFAAPQQQYDARFKQR